MAKKKLIQLNEKKKKDNSTRSLILICVGIIISFIAILATSFALLQTRIEGKKKNYIKATTFNIIFDDGSEYISLNNEGPTSDEEGILNTPYTFTINNDSELNTTNKIYFTNIESTIPDKYLKISIKIDDGDWSDPKTMNELNGIIEENKILAPKTSVTYSIVLWISSDMPNEDEQGNSLMNTSYKSKIKVETNQATSSEN